MPKGPRGERRPADAIARAVMVAKIATGEIEDVIEVKDAGKAKGGKARAAKLAPKKRKAIAKTAAKARWKKR